MNLGITSLLSLNLGAITYNCNFLILLDLAVTWITTAFNTRHRCYQLLLHYCLLTFRLDCNFVCWSASGCIPESATDVAGIAATSTPAATSLRAANAADHQLIHRGNGSRCTQRCIFKRISTFILA